MQPSKLGRESVRRESFKVKEVWGLKCLKDLEGLAERDSPATNTWCADFVMRSGQSQEYRGEWLTYQSINQSLKTELEKETNANDPWNLPMR